MKKTKAFFCFSAAAMMLMTVPGYAGTAVGGHGTEAVSNEAEFGPTAGGTAAETSAAAGTEAAAAAIAGSGGEATDAAAASAGTGTAAGTGMETAAEAGTEPVADGAPLTGYAIVSENGGHWLPSAAGSWYYVTTENLTVQSALAFIDGELYCFDANGQMLTGWQQVDDNWYYFYKKDDGYGGTTGAAAKNTDIDNFTLNENGIWHKEPEAADSPYLQVLIAAYGTETPTLQQAFQWCASMHYVRQSTPASMGVAYWAEKGLSSHSGNCYIMASTFCEMARALGYECHAMSGQVPLRRGGLGPHSWVEILVDGTWYVCDPDFTEETGKNGFLIHYGQSGTWRYQKYSVMPD